MAIGNNLHFSFSGSFWTDVHKDLPTFFCSACLPRNFKGTFVEWCTVAAHVLRISGPTTPASNPFIHRTFLIVGIFENVWNVFVTSKIWGLQATRLFLRQNTAWVVVSRIAEQVREEPRTRRHFVWLEPKPTWAAENDFHLALTWTHFFESAHSKIRAHNVWMVLG